MLIHATAHEGFADTVRESALKVDSGTKIPCRTRESNLAQRRVCPTLYQLSYIRASLFSLSSAVIVVAEREREWMCNVSDRGSSNSNIYKMSVHSVKNNLVHCGICDSRVKGPKSWLLRKSYTYPEIAFILSFISTCVQASWQTDFIVQRC